MQPIGEELDRIGQQGKAAWQRLKKDKSFEDWRNAGTAVVAGRQWAMLEAETNQAVGARYNALMANWLARYGLDDMDKGARSRLVEMMDNIGPIEEWRKTLTQTERLSLNHPNAVIRKWKAGTTIPKPKPAAPKETIRTQLAKALERITEREAKNVQLQAHIAEIEAARPEEPETKPDTDEKTQPPADMFAAFNMLLGSSKEPPHQHPLLDAGPSTEELSAVIDSMTKVLKLRLKREREARRAAAESSPPTDSDPDGRAAEERART